MHTNPDPYGLAATRRETWEGTLIVVGRTSSRLVKSEGRRILQASSLRPLKGWEIVDTGDSNPDTHSRLVKARARLRVQIVEETNVGAKVPAGSPWYYTAAFWRNGLHQSGGWYAAGVRLGASIPEIVHRWCGNGGGA